MNSFAASTPPDIAPRANPEYLLGQLIADLGKIQDTSLALETATRTGKDLFGGQAAISLLFDERNQVRFSHVEGIEPAGQPHLVEALATALLENARREGHPRPAGHGFAVPLSATDLDGTFRRLFALPLVHRGELQGGLGVFFTQDPSEPEEDTTWAGILAGTLSLSLENTRLSDGALQQSTELGAFYEATASLGEEDELPVLLTVVLDRACVLLGCRAGLVYLAGTEPSGFNLVASLGLEPGLEPTKLEPESAGGQVVKVGKAIRLNPELPPADRLAELYRTNPWIEHALAVPLLWRQELIGVLELLADGARRPFREPDLRLATLIAQQAASATGIAQLIEAERKQREMADALQSASLVLGRDLELELVLDRILDEVMRAIPCDAANFQSFAGDRSHVIRYRGYERYGLDRHAMLSIQLTEAEFGNLRRMIAGETLTVRDTKRDPEWVGRPGFEWLRSWAGAPIRFGDTILGFINLDSATPDAFDAETGRRLAAFAAHAASAMQNARLYRRQKEEHQELEIVHEIGRQLAGSLDPAEILHRLLGTMVGTVGGEFALAFRAPRRPGARLERMAWCPPDKPLPTLATDPTILRLAGQALDSGKVTRGAGEAEGSPFTAWAVRLSAGERVWGVVVQATTRVRDSLGPEAEELLGAIGQQAGLALANAERHAQVERRLAELTLLQKVVSAIASQLEVDAVLTEVTGQLHDNLGYPAVQVYRVQGPDLVLAKHSGPMPVVEHMPVERGIAGRVARTGHAAFVRDVRRDPDYVASLIGTVAEIAVPIRDGDEVVGVLNIETSEPDQLEAGALELLELLADQVSVALQNAVLYEQVRANVETLEYRVSERTALLEKAVEQGRAAERVKSQFVADVSHELRTPLTNIGLYLDLVEIGAQDRRGEYMDTLRREVERLGALIEQMLAISHLETEKVELRRRPTDLNGLLEMLVEDRARHAQQKGLSLVTQPSREATSADVDPIYILQAMTNVVNNAIHYTPAGGLVTLRIGRETWQSRPWVVFAVADTGPGVPEDEKKRIFDRFYRGLVGRTSGVAGTGLGLAISKEIVDRHGGRITLSSQMGRGATFTMWLPEASPNLS